MSGHVDWYVRAVGLMWACGLLAGVTLTAARAQTATEEAGLDGSFVGTSSNRLYHLKNCPVLRRAAARGRVELTDADEASREGYRPCPSCKPDGTSARNARRNEGASDKAESAAPPAEDTALRFTRDVAPVLVGNCVSCHDARAGERRKNFDLSTFAALMKGGDSGPAIVPGKPEESLLIQHIHGDGVAKMPPGPSRLAATTIARFEAWIKDGAKLDEGASATAELKKIAAKPEDLRRAQLGRMKPSEIDLKLEEAGRVRWSKATSEAPEVTRGASFLLLSKLPADRARALLRTLDMQAALLRDLVGPEASKVLAGPEKISLYVFTDPNAYVEFARGVETREVDAHALEAGDARANFGIEQPYIVALTPKGGTPEPTAAPVAKKTARPTRKARAEAAGRAAAADAGPERSLPGMMTDQFVEGVLTQVGNVPPWLCLGLAAHQAAQIDLRSPYYQRLRSDIAALAAQDWNTNRARNLLNDGDPAQRRAAGLSLIDFIGASSPNLLMPFVQRMIHTPNQFDDLIKQGWGLENPDPFFNTWGQWIVQGYGGR